MKAEDILEHIQQGGTLLKLGMKGLNDAFRRPMIRFFCGQGLSPEDAEETFWDTAATIVFKVDQYKDEGKAEAWFWQIARNKLIDYQRKNRRHEALRARPSFPKSDDEEERDEWKLIEESIAAPAQLMLEERVDHCVELGFVRFEEVEPERAKVLYLQLNNLSIEEIAAKIGRTTGATKEYLSQCRKKLAPYIEHCTELLSD